MATKQVSEYHYYEYAIVPLLFLRTLSCIKTLNFDLQLDFISMNGEKLESKRILVSGERYHGTANRLGNPLVTDDGKFLACSGTNLIAFDKNGTIAWIIPLQYTCRLDVAPIADDRGKVDFTVFIFLCLNIS